MPRHPQLRDTDLPSNGLRVTTSVHFELVIMGRLRIVLHDATHDGQPRGEMQYDYSINSSDGGAATSLHEISGSDPDRNARPSA